MSCDGGFFGENAQIRKNNPSRCTLLYSVMRAASALEASQRSSSVHVSLIKARKALIRFFSGGGKSYRTMPSELISTPPASSSQPGLLKYHHLLCSQHSVEQTLDASNKIRKAALIIREGCAVVTGDANLGLSLLPPVVMFFFHLVIETEHGIICIWMCWKNAVLLFADVFAICHFCRSRKGPGCTAAEI